MKFGWWRTLRHKDEAVQVLDDFAVLLERDHEDFWAETIGLCASELATLYRRKDIFRCWKVVNNMASGWGSLDDVMTEGKTGDRRSDAELTDTGVAYRRFRKYFEW